MQRSHNRFVRAADTAEILCLRGIAESAPRISRMRGLDFQLTVSLNSIAMNSSLEN